MNDYFFALTLMVLATMFVTGLGLVTLWLFYFLLVWLPSRFAIFFWTTFHRNRGMHFDP
jgi:hypothetical protein